MAHRHDRLVFARTPAALVTALALGGGLVACSASQSGDSQQTGNDLAAASTTAVALHGYKGKCLDARSGASTNGTPVQLYDCNGTDAQAWTFSGGQLLGAGGKCLDASGVSSANGTKLQLWDCWGGPNQKWSLQANGELTGIGGACADVTNFDSDNETPIQLWQCFGTENQRWTVAGGAPPPPPGPPPPPPPPPPSNARGQQCGAYVKVSPAAGRSGYYIDSSRGNDANAGSSDAPFRTVQRAANVAQAGDVVTLRTGSYSELVTVPNSGSAGAPIVFQADECGNAVFGGRSGFLPQNQDAVSSGHPNQGQHDITLAGLDFVGTNNGAFGSYSTVVYANSNWHLTNLLIDGASDIEVNVRGDATVIEQSTFLNGGSHSLVGVGGTDLVVRNVILAHNNLKNAAGDWGNSGSTKFLYTEHMLVDNIESFDNNGPGWWFDTDNKNFTIQNSYFHDMVGGAPGTADEISDGPGTVQNNVYANNAGGDVAIWESKGVTITGNTMSGSQTAFELRTITNRCEFQNGSTCTTYYQVGNLTIHDNKVKNWKGCLIGNPTYSSDPAWAAPAFQNLNIQMDRDTLWPSSTTNSCFLSWQNEPGISTFGALQSTLHVEANGTEASF